MADLFKAFDSILYDLIIAKLEAYGFHADVLKLIHDYLSHRKQIVKEMTHVVPGRIYILRRSTRNHTRLF